MTRNQRGLLLAALERNDNNRVLHIAGMDRNTEYDLLYVSGLCGKTAEEFPHQMVYELYRRADNIVGCYICDGHEVGEYLNRRSKAAAYWYRRQYCLLAHNLILGKFIKEKDYDRIFYCSPDTDLDFYRIPGEMTMGEAELVRWRYPILDYGLASAEINQRSLCDFCPMIDPDATMSSAEMRDFCNWIIDQGALDRLDMEEPELLPF